MKIPLNQAFLLKLTINQRPIVGENKQVIFQPNPKFTEYTILDSHPASPVGFGIRVNSNGNKSYYFQKKINGKVIKRKIGNLRDFKTIDSARAAGHAIYNELIAKPKVVGYTLREVADMHEKYLTTRAVPAKPNTIKANTKCRAKFKDLEDTLISNITPNLILERFIALAEKTKTTAEQTFRWLHQIIDYAIKVELLNANNEGRPSRLMFNPCSILILAKMYRGRQALEASYKAKGIRNPMAIDEQMGAWLMAIWGRRKKNRTGCDYLLATTIWGNRKVEATNLMWRDRIDDKTALTSSHIDLEKRRVIFMDTKNKYDHELPLTDCLFELFSQRHEITATAFPAHRVYVFPTEYRTSKLGHVAKGHYSDMKGLMESIKADAGIGKLTMHDLRRTFGILVEELGFPYSVTKRLLNHKSDDVTLKYTSPEWSKLVTYMQRVENKFLSYAPIIYESLRPLNVATPETGNE